jgi:2-dehydropantoate 2-reductase
MTRYVVIGAGAIGALLAAQLDLAGIDTVLVARGANLQAIRSAGLKVRRPHGTDTVRLPVVSGPEQLQLTSQDVLVLATKTQDAEEVLNRWAWLPVSDQDGIPSLLAADLPVLTFQNGLATEDLALRRFRRVYGVSIGVAASYLVPGEVVSPSYPVIGVAWLGRYPDQADPAAGQYVADLTAAGYAIESVADISAWKARKLLGNVGNGLDVLAGTPEQKAEARARLTAETTAVFAAAGIRTPAGAAPIAAGALLVEPVPGHVGGHLSTWQSFARGASSEVDYLNGEIVRLGRQHGVPTPVNERLQRLLGAQWAAGLGPGVHELSDLLSVRAETRAETRVETRTDAEPVGQPEPAR